LQLHNRIYAFGDNAAAPNALTFNKAGDLLISDSFQGAIFKIATSRNEERLTNRIKMLLN